MSAPLVLFDLTQRLFGLGSYWPFLLLAMLPHLASVVLIRMLCTRAGASEWSATAVCVILLVFGSGWENIVFGVQVTYNLSLLCFLAHVLITDHDGSLDRRDALGAVIGLVGVMSSGFGPFFFVGIAVLHLLRSRWARAAVAALPAAAAYAWWWLRWGADPAAASQPGSKAQVPTFVSRGIAATLDGLLSIGGLTGIAMLTLTAVVVMRRPTDPRQHLVVALTFTMIVMFAGIGWQRIGLGADSATASRYLYMAAILLAPLLAIACDLLGRLAPAALLAGRLILVGSAIINAGQLRADGATWAGQANDERIVLELVAGSGQIAAADPERSVLVFSQEVRVADIPYLVAEHAIVPRVPATPEQWAIVAYALGLPALAPAPTP